MQDKIFFRRMAAAALLCLLSIVLLNYWLDRNGVFTADFSRPRLIDVNERFVKMRYVLRHPREYDAFVFGSSRVRALDPLKIDDGHAYYNMAYAYGLPREWLANLRLLLDRGVNVRKAWFGLDDFSIVRSPQENESNFGTRQYAASEWENRRYVLQNLLRLPDLDAVKAAVRDEETQRRGIVYDIYAAGASRHCQDAAIERDAAKHIAEPYFQRPTRQRLRFPAYDRARALADIRQICQLARAHGIETIFFIHPLHQATYLAQDLDEFDAFRRELALLTPYYDFSGLNAVTTDNYYYYETSHYRHMVGDWIINRIVRGDAAVPEGFGARVTPDNVDAHLRRLAQREGR